MNTILQVEDDPNDVFFLKRALKTAGVANPIQVVNNGREAIDYLKGAGKFADREQFPLPGLVFLDLKLPHVMGLEVLKWIRQESGLSLVVVLLTASAEEADIASAYHLGANGFLVKPSEASKLVEMAKAIKDFWLTFNVLPPQLHRDRAAAARSNVPGATHLTGANGRRHGEWPDVLRPTGQPFDREKKAHMKTTNSGVTETVKDKIIAAIVGTGDIVQATVDTVTQILATAIKDTGKVGTSVSDVIADVTSGAVCGAVQVGADVGHAAKGIMVGVLRGTKETGTAVLDTISHTSHATIRDTAVLGGDLEAAATGLVVGAIEGAKKMGVSAEEAAAAAADGALKAAGQVGSTAVETVRKAVTKPVNGVKVVLKEPEMVASKSRSANPDWVDVPIDNTILRPTCGHQINQQKIQHE